MPHPWLWGASNAPGWDHVSRCVIFYVVNYTDIIPDGWNDTLPDDFSLGNRFIHFIDDDTIDLVSTH